MSIIESTLPIFPECPTYGFSVQPWYVTNIVMREEGYETVDRRWARCLHMFTAIPMGDKDEADIQAILYFWHAMGGRADRFRIKDWTDYKSCKTHQVATALDGPLMPVTTSDGTLYRIVKRYTSGALTQDREIQAPIGDTILVANESGVLQDPSHYEVDEGNGFIKPLAGFTGTPTTWGGEFNVVVRFNSELEIIQTNKQIQSLNFQLMAKRIALAKGLSNDVSIGVMKGAGHIIISTNSTLQSRHKLHGSAALQFSYSANGGTSRGRIRGSGSMSFAGSATPSSKIIGNADIVFDTFAQPHISLIGTANVAFDTSGTLKVPGKVIQFKVNPEFSSFGDSQDTAFDADTQPGSTILAFVGFHIQGQGTGSPSISDGTNTYSPPDGSTVVGAADLDLAWYLECQASYNSASISASTNVHVDWSALGYTARRFTMLVEVEAGSVPFVAAGVTAQDSSDNTADALTSGSLINPTTQDVVVIGLSADTAGTGSIGGIGGTYPIPGGGTGFVVDDSFDYSAGSFAFSYMLEEQTVSSSGSTPATATNFTDGSGEYFITLGIMLMAEDPPPPPTHMRQIRTSALGSSVKSQHLAFLADTLPGSTILVYAWNSGNPGASATFSDGTNTYTEEDLVTASDSSQINFGATYNAAAITAGTNFVADYGSGSSAAFIYLTIVEMTDVASSGTKVDQAGQDTGGIPFMPTDGASSGSMSNPSPQRVVVCGVSQSILSGTHPNAGTGFTQQGTGWATQTASPSMMFEEKEVSTSGTHELLTTPSVADDEFINIGIMLKLI